MTLFKVKDNKVLRLKERQIDLEKDVQKLTESNLNEIFGLKFIHSEFIIQNFRIDTVAFDDNTKSFVIIEYKKDRNISVIAKPYKYLFHYI